MQHRMAAYTLKPSKACTARPNQDYWQTSSLKTFEQTRIQTEQTGTRTLETWHTASTIHFGCWQLRSKIYWQRTCQSSQMSYGRTLHTHLWLNWETLHWHHIRLELLEMPGSLVDAKIRDESVKIIPTHCQKMSICTIPVRPNSVQSQNTIRNAGIESTLTQWQGQMIHPADLRQILIPGQSSIQHSPSLDQCHHIPIIQTNRGHNAANPPTPQLPSHPRRCLILLAHEQYGISCPQQCQLLKQAQITQQSWQTLHSLQQHNGTTKQWGGTQHCSHHQNCHVISHQSGTGRTVHHGAWGIVHQNHTWRISTQAATNAPTNQQCNGRHHHQWQNTTTKKQGNGHEVPLAKRLQMPTTILNLLATWKIESCRLLDKAPFRIPSS